MTSRARRQSRRVTFGPDRHERDELLIVFGGNLRALRGAAGLSQERLAMRCFMRRDQIWAFESGRRALDLPDLLVLAQRLGVSVGVLTEGLEAPVRRVGTAQVLDLITRQPVIKDDGLAASLGLPRWYVSEIILYLQSLGAIRPTRTGWQPVPKNVSRPNQ
jgi:transcriptional regulator with XRE-family HTH domain